MKARARHDRALGPAAGSCRSAPTASAAATRARRCAGTSRSTPSTWSWRRSPRCASRAKCPGRGGQGDPGVRDRPRLQGPLAAVAGPNRPSGGPEVAAPAQLAALGPPIPRVHLTPHFRSKSDGSHRYPAAGAEPWLIRFTRFPWPRSPEVSGFRSHSRSWRW